MNIYLDDCRQPKESYSVGQDQVYLNLPWRISRSYDHFVHLISRLYAKQGELPTLISFDHDLMPEHYANTLHQIPYAEYKSPCGYHAAQWLITFCGLHSKSLPRYLCHSANPDGRDNILELLKKADKPFRRGDRVKITGGNPEQLMGKECTVSHMADDGQLVLILGNTGLLLKRATTEVTRIPKETA